jgi:hypothetical protein
VEFQIKNTMNIAQTIATEDGEPISVELIQQATTLLQNFHLESPEAAAASA